MKNSKLVMAGVALAFLTGGVSAALAQGAPDEVTGVPSKKMNVHGHAARTDIKTEAGYRPLTVGGPRHVAVAPSPAGVVTGIGDGLAAPFNSASSVGGPVGAGFGIAGGVIGGAGNFAAAPLSGLFGGDVGISSSAAPPLPIKARYAHTGAVATTVYEGYSQDVPVDKSGPIYMIDNAGNERKVTPFSLLAFPLVGAGSIIATPFRHPIVPLS